MVSQLFVGEGLEGSAILGLGTSVVGLGALDWTVLDWTGLDNVLECFRSCLRTFQITI